MRNILLILLLLTQAQTVRPGTIAGQVLAIDGTPAANLRVSAMELTDNTTAPALVGFAQTDAAGRYRIEGLPPGRYYILAGPLNSATYYPGSADLNTATAIAVTAGATLETVNFGLSPINQSGVIQAAVVRLDTSAPISGAQVSLRRPTTNPGQDFLSGTTDAAGQVTFGLLAPGNYNVIVQSDGYIAARGGRGAASVSAPVSLTTQEREGRVVFRLQPAGILEGRVQTERGQAVANASVSLAQLGYREGMRGLTNVAAAPTARTDTNGRFRLTAPDGQYYLRVQMQAAARGGTSAVSYYPGVTEFDKATLVGVTAVSPKSLNITVPEKRGFTISGTITNPLPGGRTYDTTVFRGIASFYLVPKGSIDFNSPLIPNARLAAPSATDAVVPFAIENVPPGDYDLYPLFADDTVSGAITYHTARTPVSVREANITDLRITLRPGINLKGQFVPDGPLPPVNWDSLRLSVRNTENLPTLVGGGFSGYKTVDPQTKAFTFTGLIESQFSILVSGLPNGVYVADIRQSGRSIYADNLLDTRSGSVEPIEIVLRSGTASVEGTFRIPPSQPASVVLVPTSGHNVLLIRRATTGSPRGNTGPGAFSMTNVAPGDYTIYAFAGVSQGAPEQSKEYMAQYKGRGRAIQLRASETLRLELDVIGDSAANIDERLADSGPPEISNRIVRTPDMPMVTEQASPPTPQRGRGARGARGTTAAPVTRGQRGDAAGVAALREALAGGLNTAAERTNVLNLITQNVNALMTPANERTFVERALQTAQTLEPNNPLWPSQLGRLYATAAEFPSLSDLSLTPAQAATKAVESFEKAATLGDTGQTSEIAEAARRANLLDKAETYAKQALAGRPDDVHAANRTLGLIALQQGDVAAAKRYLLASGNVAGSPVLRSFGPTMNLATELLNKGERETVIAYLERCLTFWTSGEEQLKGWIESLKSGGTPVLRSSTGR